MAKDDTARQRVDRFKQKIEQLAAHPRGEEYIGMIGLLMDALIIADPSETAALSRLVEHHSDADQLMRWAFSVLARRS